MENKIIQIIDGFLEIKFEIENFDSRNGPGIESAKDRIRNLKKNLFFEGEDNIVMIRNKAMEDIIKCLIKISETTLSGTIDRVTNEVKYHIEVKYTPSFRIDGYREIFDKASEKTIIENFQL